MQNKAIVYLYAGFSEQLTGETQWRDIKPQLAGMTAQQTTTGTKKQTTNNLSLSSIFLNFSRF